MIGSLPEDLEPRQGEILLQRTGRALQQCDAPISHALPLIQRAVEVARMQRKRAHLQAVKDEPQPAAELHAYLPPFLGDLCLAQACAGHPRIEPAWSLLTRRHAPRLVAQATSMGCTHPEDEVHDLLLDLWMPGQKGESLLASYAGRAPLAPWLGLVLRRRIIAIRKSSIRQASLYRVSAELGQTGPSAAEVVAEEETRELLQDLVTQSLEGLSSRDRELIEARYLRIERGIVTARRMGVSPSYVSKRCKQVLELMQRRLPPVLRRQAPDILEASDA